MLPVLASGSQSPMMEHWTDPVQGHSRGILLTCRNEEGLEVTRQRGVGRGKSSGPQRPGGEAEETESLFLLYWAYFLLTSPSQETHLVNQSRP